MLFENIPDGEKVFPGEKCIICNTEIEVYEQDGDTIYLSCPNSKGDDGHTEYRFDKEFLEKCGWKI